jgi:radical SAM protein with 4Fe4S-binding SPASM domain
MKMTKAEYLSRAVTWTSGQQLLRPKYLVIESTNHCQLACEVCGATSARCSRTRGIMDWELFQDLVDQAVLLRPDRVCLHAFGEPLLHPRIVDMVALLARRGLRAELVTNGELLTPELARGLRQAGLFELGISHPNITPVNYQICRGKPAPPGIDDQIAKAVSEWEGQERQVSIRCLVLKKLLSKGAPESAVFLDRWLSTPGVGIVALHGYLPWPRHVCPELIDFLLAKPRRCPVCMQTLTVLWDGTVTPCSYDVNAEVGVGSFPADNLVKLYNSAQLRVLRKSWMRRNSVPAICRNCLIPRCPTAAAWIGRDEWHDRNAPGSTQKLAWLGVTAKHTLRQNRDIHGDRI